MKVRISTSKFLLISLFVAGILTSPVYGSSIEFTGIAKGSTDTVAHQDSIPADSLAHAKVDSSLAVKEPESELVKPSDFDHLLTVRGENLIVKVKQVNLYEVVFTWPLNTLEEKLPKEEINEIAYSDGHKEYYKTKPAETEAGKNWAVTVTEKDWERVTVVNVLDSVSGLIEMGKLTAKYEASKINATTDYLEKNALIILRKKAARLGANVVLTTDKKEYRAYGELPNIEISGTAYLKQ